jgi:hypothetical protein
VEILINRVLTGHSRGRQAPDKLPPLLINKNVKVKVKYSFVLHTGFAGSPFYFRIITSHLKMSGIP